MHPRRLIAGLVALSLLTTLTYLSLAEPPSLRPAVFAITGARVVTEPGKVLPKATVIVRDGVIEAVGPDVQPPADALVIDGAGLTVYPGFLDAMSNWGYDNALRRSEGGPAGTEDLASEALAGTKPDNRKGITPEFQVRAALKGSEEPVAAPKGGRRGGDFPFAAPQDKGKAEEDPAEQWRKIGFTAHLIAPDGGILVGQSALVSLSGAAPREAVLRTPVALHAALRTVQAQGSDYPRALMGAVAHARQTFLDAGWYARTWRAFEENGGVGKRPPLDPALAALGLPLEGKMPVVFEADTRDEIHRALDFAAEFKLKPIIYGGRHAAKAVERLKAENVPVLLRLNYSEGPARRRFGFFEPPPGMETPPPEEDKTPARAKEDRERQQKEEQTVAAALDKAGVRFAISTQGLKADKFRTNLRKAIESGLSADAALRALTVDAAAILGVEKQLGNVAAGKAAHLVVTDGDFQAEQTHVRHVFADGAHFEFDPSKDDEGKEGKKDKGGFKKDGKRGPKDDSAKEGDKKEGDKKEADKKEPQKKPEPATEIDADRRPKTRTGGNVLVHGATVLTVTNGVKEATDILVQKGKIVEIGQGLKAPEGTTIIEAAGLFVMPGIIDTHSHFAVSGGVNEFSLSVVPEVGCRDVIDSEDVQIYRAAAGGVTTARLLHGSANVIGGQDAVIKTKYGEPASKLLVADAPRGVKFALGENVKRTDGRFPNTRMGVEAVLIRAFTEAQAYRKTWDDYEQAKKAGKRVAEPRRDLRLEALADVLKGDLRVHCHCYRADEILMLLRVADRFGFKVRSLQHVLEGYKVAAEIAAHGCSCSSFSDWWAYKIEVIDAIPFNAALLNEAGAVVCLKSDSNELMRHLYQEAAKCVKYGGMSETDALKTITLNAAIQLGLDKRLGSIDVGKDADLAIFNGHPLNSYARPEMTLIDGEVYFQRAEKLAPMVAAAPAPAKAVPFKVPAPGADAYILESVTVHPATGPALVDYRVVVRGGKIGQMSPMGTPGAKPEGTLVDAKGMHLYPGMIDAATVLGLTEIGSAQETHDFAEGGDFQPDLRASTAINPDSELIPVTRANGVLTVLTRPTGSIIAGQGALINLAGWVPREMAVVDPVALNIEFPTTNPAFSFDPSVGMVGRALAKKQREEKLRRLRELFKQAAAHDAARKASPTVGPNPRLEALVPYLRGEKPVLIHADRQQEIRDALDFAGDFKLKAVITGGLESWKVADELKKKDVPVILGPTMAMPQEQYDPYDSPMASAAKLQAAGVKFCIRSAGSTNTRNLPYEAAMAASYGLAPEEALKAVTLYPAQILGVADQLGSVEQGKRANLVLANGDILQASTQVMGVFIDGKPLEPTSKHTRLYERYQQRLREVKDGKAPLGTK